MSKVRKNCYCYVCGKKVDRFSEHYHRKHENEEDQDHNSTREHFKAKQDAFVLECQRLRFFSKAALLKELGGGNDTYSIDEILQAVSNMGYRVIQGRPG